MTIDGLHLENLEIDEAYPTVIFLANLAYDIRTVTLSGEVFATGFATFFRGFGGSSIVLSGVNDESTLTSGKKLYLFQGTNDAPTNAPSYTLIGKAFSDNANFEVTDASTSSYVNEY